MNPPSVPSRRRHGGTGIMSAIGFAPHACPTARGAVTSFCASSPYVRDCRRNVADHVPHAPLEERARRRERTVKRKPGSTR
jgi:hypothetical protein